MTGGKQSVGAAEVELRRLQQITDWRIPKLSAMQHALGSVDRTLSAIVSSDDAWKGVSADGAREKLSNLQRQFSAVRDCVDVIGKAITSANEARRTAITDTELPSATVDPFWENAVKAGSTVVHPVLGPLAADKALEVIQDFLGNQREERARQVVERVRNDLEYPTERLRDARIALSRPIEHFDIPEPPREDDDSGGTGPSGRPHYPDGTGGPGGPNLPLPPTGPVVPEPPDFERPEPPDFERPEPPDFERPEPPGPDGPLDPPDFELPDERNPPDDPSVDGPGDGGTGPGGPGPNTGGPGTPGGSGGTSLGTGSSVGNGLAVGAGGAAGLAAMKAAGGIGGLASPAAAGMRSGGGLLGNVAGAGAPGGANAASGSGARGGMGMMGGAGGAASSEKKTRGSGLGGPIAPQLEDDDDMVPRSQNARAGSRADLDE